MALVAGALLAGLVVAGPAAAVDADEVAAITVPGREAIAAPGVEGSIYRLYLAFFDRAPDAGGYDHWVAAYVGGTSLAGIASWFAGSPEFEATYGSLDAPGFVRLVYRDVLGRDADPGGEAYWLDRLAEGRSRGWLMVMFSESPEFVSLTATPPPSASAPPVASGALCLGDSVMLGASPTYHDTLATCAVVDATVSRQMTAAAAVASGHLAAGLPPAVVVHLGTNGTAAGVDELLAVLAPVPRVVLVDVQTNGARSWEGPVSAALAAAAERWPNVTLASWRSWSAGRPAWFAADGIHLTRAGAAGYAALIADALS